MEDDEQNDKIEVIDDEEDDHEEKIINWHIKQF